MASAEGQRPRAPKTVPSARGASAEDPQEAPGGATHDQNLNTTPTTLAASQDEGSKDPDLLKRLPTMAEKDITTNLENNKAKHDKQEYVSSNSTLAGSDEPADPHGARPQQPEGGLPKEFECWRHLLETWPGSRSHASQSCLRTRSSRRSSGQTGSRGP